MTDTELKCRNAKEAAKKLSTASANDKNKALLLIAEELKSNKDYILRENDKDMKAAEERLTQGSFGQTSSLSRQDRRYGKGRY